MPKMLYVTNEMKSRANKIGVGTDEIFNSQKEITKIFQNMGRDFSGKIPTLMNEKMIAMEDDYIGINEKLKQYKDFLIKSADEVEWTDSEASRWAQALGR